MKKRSRREMEEEEGRDAKDPRHDLAIHYISQPENIMKICSIDPDLSSNRFVKIMDFKTEIPLHGAGGYLDGRVSLLMECPKRVQLLQSFFTNLFEPTIVKEMIEYAARRIVHRLIEVKISSCMVGEILRQVSYYRRHHNQQQQKDSVFWLVTTFDFSQAEKELLKLHNLLHIRLAAAFHRWMVEQNKTRSIENADIVL